MDLPRQAEESRGAGARHRPGPKSGVSPGVAILLRRLPGLPCRNTTITQRRMQCGRSSNRRWCPPRPSGPASWSCPTRGLAPDMGKRRQGPGPPAVATHFSRTRSYPRAPATGPRFPAVYDRHLVLSGRQFIEGIRMVQSGAPSGTRRSNYSLTVHDSMVTLWRGARKPRRHR